MREYKFRAFDKDRKEYLSAGQVYLSILPGANPKDGKVYLDEIEYEAKHRFIIEQYTGLKDKKGKEMFEGDIVKHKDGDVWLVEYEYGEANGYAWQGYGCFCKSEWQYIEIIGNIHEHPELLK